MDQSFPGAGDERATRLYTLRMHAEPDRKRLLARYRATVEALERVQFHDLAGMTDEEAWRRIQLLSTPGPVWRDRPEWSGLVEMQRLFHRRKQS